MPASIYSGPDQLSGWTLVSGSETHVAYPAAAAAAIAHPLDAYLVVITQATTPASTDYTGDPVQFSFGNCVGTGYFVAPEYQGSPSSFCQMFVGVCPLIGWDGVSNLVTFKNPSFNGLSTILTLANSNAAKPGAHGLVLYGVPPAIVPTVQKINGSSNPSIAPTAIILGTNSNDFVFASGTLLNASGQLNLSLAATGGALTPTISPQWPVGTGVSAHAAGAMIAGYAESSGGTFTVSPNNTINVPLSIDVGTQNNGAFVYLPLPIPVIVPDVTLHTLADASTILAGVGLVLGAVTYLHSPIVPVGEIIYQNPLAGASVAPGSAISVSVSIGPATYFVPYVIGDTNSAAAAAIASAGLTVGAVTFVHSLYVPAGTVINQNPVAGTPVPLGYPVDLVESSGPPPPPPQIAPFDVDLTVISQYQNSPTLMALVENMAQYVDPRTNLETFFSYVWDVDTAVGFGLDIWGRIVGVSRLLQISGTNNLFGFFNSDVPFDWQPWSQAPFDGGPLATSSYLLPDDAFRTLILTKALANIVATTAPALNQLLKNLFPGRGICYVLDNGGMAMTFVFEFALTNIEFAILTQSGALPHPAGVSFNVIMVPAGGTFGFKQQAPTALPFNQGTFYKR